MRKYIFLIIYILTFSKIGVSQEAYTKKIDSLTEATKTKSDTYASYEQLTSLLAQAPKKDVKKMLDYALSRNNSDLNKIFLYQGYSMNLIRSGELNKSIEYRRKGLYLSQKEDLKDKILYYHIDLANTYQNHNSLDSATYHLNKAQVIAENGYRDWMWQVHYNRALVQITLGNEEKSAHYHRLMWQEVENSVKITSQNRGFALWVITYFFLQTDKFPEDQVKFLDLLAREYGQNDPNTPEGHIDIRQLFNDEINSENIEKYKRLITISDNSNQINSYYHNVETLVQILVKENRYQDAIIHLKKLEHKLQNSKQENYKLGTYQHLTTSYINIGNYAEALKYKEKQHQLEDSLITKQMRINVAELEVKFDTEKKERQIVEQQLTLERKNKEQARIKYGIIALGTILLASFFFFFYRIKTQKRLASQQEAIRVKEITALKQHNKLLALNSMIEGQETERLRIAQDLHDSLGGLLSTVKAHFSVIQKEIKHLESLNITEKTNSLIDEACTEVRRISHNMLPHGLTISGLQGVMEDIKQQLETEGYTVTFEMDTLQKSEYPTRDVMVYRLLQEIISNMRKHAKATSIFLQILQTDFGLSILFEDDGEGFDYEKAISKGGLGLKSINSRIAYLDGTIDWDSRIKEGTSITITIPQK